MPNDLSFDDLPEIQHIDADVDLDSFASEPVPIKASSAPAAPVQETRVNLKAVPQAAPQVAPPAAPHVTTQAAPAVPSKPQSPVMQRREPVVATPIAGLRTIMVPGSPAQRVVIAAISLTAIIAAASYVGKIRTAAPNPARETVVPTAPVLPAASTPAASVLTGKPAVAPAVPTTAVAAVTSASAPAPAAATPQVVRPAVVPAPPTSSDAAGVVAVGWLKVQSPLTLDISNGGNVIGTTRADRTMLPAGDYDLAFINEDIGYREVRRVNIVAGKVRQIDVRIPDGMISVNARPWANVVIDGKPVGETPLGNLTIAAGVHQLLFSHPQLGQRRVEATVRAGQHVRLNVNLTSDQD